MTGNNLGVGLVVFLVLIIIQFVVITKGSGRVSEVAARFVLDAMPGKQMAIDADLNGGLIDSDEARSRRDEGRPRGGVLRGHGRRLEVRARRRGRRPDHHRPQPRRGIAIGAMGGMSMGQAVERYSMLTIGDGLVSQIPALLISTAAGVLVTKDSSDSGLGPNLATQLGKRPKATAIAASTIFAIGLLPGMPSLPFFVLAIALLALWRNGMARCEREVEQERGRREREERRPPGRRPPTRTMAWPTCSRWTARASRSATS